MGPPWNPLDVQPGNTYNPRNPILWPVNGTGIVVPYGAVDYFANRSKQPYATNIANLMVNVEPGTGAKCAMPDFNVETRRFFVNFINHQYPEKKNSIYNSYYNNAEIRKALKNLL